ELCALVLRDRILWPWWCDFVRLQPFVGQFNGFFKLWVVAAHDKVGPLRYYVVRIDTALLDHPFAAVVGAPEAEAWSSDETTVAQRLHVADANQPAPCARSDDWPDFFAAEEPRERIAA